MILAVDHINIVVADLDRAVRFYTEVLGFRKRIFMPDALLAIVMSSDDPDGTSLLLEPNNNPIAKTYQEGLFNNGVPAIVFTAHDVQQEYERLLAAGVKFRNAPVKTEYGIEALFEDGCGNIIQLYQA